MMAICDCVTAVKWLLVCSISIENNAPAPVHAVNCHRYGTTWFKPGAAATCITSKYGNVNNLSRMLEAICKDKCIRDISRLQNTTGFGVEFNYVLLLVIFGVSCLHWPVVLVRYFGLEKVLTTNQSINHCLFFIRRQLFQTNQWRSHGYQNETQLC